MLEKYFRCNSKLIELLYVLLEYLRNLREMYL